MTAHLLIGSITAVLSLMLGLFFVSVARVPGWHHYRTFSFIALLTAGYAGLDIASGSTSGFHWQTEINASMSLLVALASGPLWLRFDCQQQQRKLDRLELAAMGVLLLGCLLCFIPYIMVGELDTIESSWIRIQYHVRATNALAEFFLVVLLACMLQLLARYAYRAWHGRGSWLAMGAVLILTLGEIQEGLVASQIIDWPFLGCVGLTLALLLIAMELGAEVASNANQLADFHFRLKARVAKRTEELVFTRNALMATDRQVAIGHLAASVGHEINNPLSYVKGNLDFIHEQLLSSSSSQDCEKHAVEDALHGVERIRVVVNNLVTYARSAPLEGAAQVSKAVDLAMRIVRPQSKFAMNMIAQLGDTEPVAIDESKLVQVLVSVLINASQANLEAAIATTTTIRSWQKDDTVTIEIADEGCGMTPDRLEALLQPLPFSKGPGDIDGIGIFLCRSLIETSGGSLSIVSREGHGTTVEIELVVAQREQPHKDGISIDSVEVAS